MSHVVALTIDGLLTAGFGFQHSILATVRLKTAGHKAFGIGALAWRSLESLVNVFYILIAALFWIPVNEIIWSVGGLEGGAITCLLVASWI